jgi:hypothetical protein
MADTTDIKANEILQRRKGLRMVPKLFIGNSQPTLSLHSMQLMKLDRFEQDTVHQLPPTLITNIGSLPLLRCYRTLFIQSSNNSHVVSEPSLNIFPYVLDHPELFELLLSRTKLLKATFIKNSSKAIEMFRKNVLLFWPAFSNCKSIDAKHTENHEGHDTHLERMPHDSISDFSKLLMQETTKQSNPFPNPNTRKDGKGPRSKNETLYTPFKVNEVILNVPSNASAVNTLMNFYG